jgi:sulfonate transport system ATP-binding protein
MNHSSAVSVTEENIVRKKAAHIQLEQVEKSFEDKQVLKGIDLEFVPGEFIAIVGKSGSGKSTLLRLVAGLDTPSRGNILLNGVHLSDARAEATVMFQDSRLLPWKKVIENVGIGLKGDWRQKAEKVLSEVGLLDFKDEWPSTLSGGQKQRVALARALVHQPSLLLLDEPLSALDALTRMEMQQLIERLWLEQGFTALLVTHDVREAVRLADRIILIENGSIAMDLRNAAPRPRHFTDTSLVLMENRVVEKIMGGRREA